jgi:hypothetical protein
LGLAVALIGAWTVLLFAVQADRREDVASMYRRTPSELKPFAVAPGQRLQTAGRERITAAGTIVFFGEGQKRTEPVRFTLQYPLKLRLDFRDSYWIVDRSGSVQGIKEDRNLTDAIQVILEDSVEGFFALQKGRISRRYLGSGFSLPGAYQSAAGMDVYVLTYPDAFRVGRTIQKSYWFDSRTKLLGVVAYLSPSGAANHVVLDDWRNVHGEQLAFRVERWEDGKLRMQLMLDSAAVAPAGANETFGDQ